MKHKCSFILKASTALVLALVMLFGTVATSIAAVVDNADTGAESADLADTGTNGAVVSDGSNVFLYIKTDAGQDGWNDAGAITGVEFSTGGDSNAGTTQRVDAHTDVTISGTSYWRYAVPSGTWYYVKPYRINPTGYDSSKNDNNVWTWANHRIALHTDDNRINKLWETGSEFTWGDDIIEYPPAVSITAPQNFLAADNTSTVTLSSTYTNSSYINGTKTWSTTTGSSVGSSTGVFKASKSGTYTVTCTLSYNVKGYSGITGSATETYNMHAGYPAGKRLLVNPSGGALTATPNWGVHLFNDNTGAVYYANVSECSTESGYYYIDIPAMTSLSTCYTHLQWLRVANGQTVNGLTSWDNTKIWNNSGNIVYDSGSSYNCFDYNAADKSSSTTNTLTHTHKLYAYTYRRENPTTAYSLYATLKNNFDVECGTTSVSVTASSAGYTFDGWKRNSSVSTSGQGTATTAVSSEETASLNTQAVESYYYANYTHYNTQISFTQTGGTGTIQIGGTTGTSKYVSTGASTALSITPPTGYTISDVTCTSGTAPTWTTSTATSYVGTVTPAADTAITVTYSEIKPNVALNVYSNGSLSVDGGKVSINGDQSNLAENTINPGISSHVTALHSAPASGYTFTGWTVEGDEAEHIQLYTSTTFTDANKYTPGGTDTTIYIKTDGASGLDTSNAIIKAHFQKVHYITVYNTTMYDRAHWVEISSPPQQVKVYGANGVNKTYKYAYGNAAQRGEDNAPQNGGVASTTHIVDTDDQTYYEGNKLQVFEGDRVELIYSALASSDIITGVFYNNSIRYTTGLETDNLFYKRIYREGGYGDRETGSGSGYHDFPEGAPDDAVPDDDVDYFYDANYDSLNGVYDGHALYANEYYYYDDIRDTINAATVAGSYAASVDQNTHTISWTIGPRDYLNVDLELDSKKSIHFSDTKNTVIKSVHTDDYYAVGEAISPGDDPMTTPFATRLAVYAKGDANQTNKITKDNIKFYYANSLGKYINPTTGRTVKEANRVEITGVDPNNTITVHITEGTYIQNSGDTASVQYIYFEGAMPATDVYVDLNLEVSYAITLKSKIQSDTIGLKTAFGQVADLTLGSNPKVTKANGNTGVIASGTYVAGQNISLKAENITDGYMFIGWYPDDGSGAPDLSATALPSKAITNYKPEKSMTIWAVGTRDLYINGSRYLFSDYATRTDWAATNVKMQYDAAKKKYYHEIDATTFAAASSAYTCVDNGTTTTGGEVGYFESGTHRYWNTNTGGTTGKSDADYHGNAFFRFLDTETGDSNATNRSVWKAIESFEVDTVSTDKKIKYGKAVPRDSGGATDPSVSGDGQGFIVFSEATNDGYSTPIRIYYDPAAPGTFSVEASPIYPEIYLSNGYKMEDKYAEPSVVTFKIGNSDTVNRNDNANDSNGADSNCYFTGYGWTPGKSEGGSAHGSGGEGTIRRITIKKRNTTLHLTKSVTDPDKYKVSNFIVYNITQDDVNAVPATRDGETANYTADVQTHENDAMYIVPIVEYCGSGETMTVLVNSKGVDYDQWGDLISCYAWYSNSKGDAYGKYPGQLMIPDTTGESWKATFPVKSSDGKGELVGITFANYVNASSDCKTWLDDKDVMGTVSAEGQGEPGSGNIIPTYNMLVRRGVNKDGTPYNYGRTNFKAQTYDYREPIAYYKNKPEGASNSMLTFALKQGDGDLIGWTHNDLVGSKITNYIGHETWPVYFEYLTDSTGNSYADLNGYLLPNKPTASFYICAKGMVSYNANAMSYCFWSGANYQTPNGSNPSGKGGFGTIEYKDYDGYTSGNNNLEMKYAVQWYVYDASGNYITTVLSAANADKTNKVENSEMSVITQRLLDLGYAVEGRSVAICYDVPRSCYNDNGAIPNSDTSTFNCYRFTGQWYQDNEYKTAKVYAKVGIMTDGGEDVADSSVAPYGSASVAVNNSLCSVAGHSGTDEEDDVLYGYTTVVDGDKGAITLTASSQNFIGWHHYEGGKLVQDTDKDHPTFVPASYSTDTTYIALYEAKVNFSYNYVGRENTAKAYGVGSDIHLTDDEIGNGNKVDKSTRLDAAGTNSPGETVVGMFKKKVSFQTPTNELVDNSREYVLDVNTAQYATQSYKITAKYRSADGSLFDYTTDFIEYNKVVNLRNVVGGLTHLPDAYDRPEHRFIGWYEYIDATHVGELLSVTPNYGMRMLKEQTIVAVYVGDVFNVSLPEVNDQWYVSIDDQEVTYEMTSTDTGTVYNDAIVRVRKNGSNVTDLTNGRLGVIVVEDGGSGQAIDTRLLEKYAVALSGSSGTSGNSSVTVEGTKYVRKVTNLFTSSVNNFGRADLAAKYGFSNVTGHSYYIYAYYCDGDPTVAESYHFNKTAVTGTYRSITP